MAIFTDSIPPVLHNEGGSKPSPDNDGGTVRDGINSKSFPNMPAGFYDGTMDDATALAVAQGHYRSVEWAGISGDQIEDNVLACSLLDAAVNLGVGGAVLLVQVILNLRFNAGLTMDAGMGPKTLAAINAAGPSLAEKFNDARAGWYAKASLGPQGKGWLETWLARIPACENNHGGGD